MFLCFWHPPADIHLPLSSPMFCHSSPFFNASALAYLPPCLLLIISSPSSTSCMQLLLSQQRWQRMPQPPPQSDTSCHYTAPVLPRVPCDARGRGCMAWELKGEGVAEGLDCMAPLTLDWPESEPSGCPLASCSRDTLHPTWQNTSVGGTCVCVCSIWMTSHVA